MQRNKGFTLIELLVVISIIALLSSIVAAAVTKSRIKARDAQRIQNARQLAIALEQYEATYNTYKVSNAGKNDSGYGYVAKGSGTSGYNNSILSVLKSSGVYTNTNLTDPIYGTDNYYLGLCTSTNAYNIFVKLEQSQYNNSTTSISNTCGGAEAASLGFNFIASTVGGTSGGGGDTNGLGGSYEAGMGPPPTTVTGPDGLTYGMVTAEDGRVWLDRNLGATQVATAYNDALSYGYYYQWGRGVDGHQILSSTATSSISNTDSPGHAKFITSTTSPFDWRSPQNNSLWQGVSGTNNPCPVGFRIPTSAEWQTWINAINNFTSALCGTPNNCHTIALNSTLKLPLAGYRARGDSLRYSATQFVFYATSNISGTDVLAMSFGTNSVTPFSARSRADAYTVRCVKN